MIISIVKDKFLLIITGVVCAGSAAIFWSYFKENGFAILLIIPIFTLTLDNRRLRVQLAQKSIKEDDVDMSD